MFIYFDADKWLKKIPRPERSGCISVVIAMCLLYELVTPSYPLEHFCQLLPWGCPVTLTQDRHPEKRPHVALVFGNGPGNDSDICHMDLLTTPALPEREALIHFKTFRLNRKDLPGYWFPNSEQWQDYPWADDPNYTQGLVFISGSTGKMLTIPYNWRFSMRWHCPEKNPSKLPAGQKMQRQPAEKRNQ